MANFPLATWQVYLPAFNASLGAGSPVSVHPGGVGHLGWGFGVDDKATGDASAASIAGAFRDAMAAAFPAGVFAATYLYTNNTVPSTSPLVWTLASATASGAGGVLQLSFATLADAAVYGFNAQTIVITGGVNTTTTTYNPGGVWVPCGVAGDLRRATVQRAAASSSEMSGLSTDVVNWGQVANLEFLSSIFPAGNLTRWYAQIEPFYTAAGRDKDDPNNTLEGLLEAAATGVTFRLYRQASDLAPGTSPYEPNEARMPTIADNAAVSSYVQADDEPRLWSTTGLFFRGNT